MIIRKCISSKPVYLFFDSDRCLNTLYKHLTDYNQIISESKSGLQDELKNLTHRQNPTTIKKYNFNIEYYGKLLTNVDLCIKAINYTILENDIVNDFQINKFNSCFPECTFDPNLMIIL